MPRTKSLDATRICAKGRDYGINTSAEVINVRHVCADVYPWPLNAVGAYGDVNHHPGPEKFVSTLD